MNEKKINKIIEDSKKIDSWTGAKRQTIDKKWLTKKVKENPDSLINTIQ